MEYRRPDHLRDLGAILGGTGIVDAMRGETDLVVDDDVQGSAGAEPPRLRHLKRLHHDALPGERRVAVNDDRHHEVASGIPSAILPGAHGPFHHGRDDLEVRRVECERDVHLASGRFDIRGETLVVLDIAHRGRLDQAPLKLVEQIAGMLAEDVDQDVQPATVRHADDRLDHTMGTCPLQRFVQHGYQTVGAFEAEPLRSGILGVEILLKTLGGRQPLQHDAFLRRVQCGVRARRFHAPAYPQLLRRIRDMHVFHANG